MKLRMPPVLLFFLSGGLAMLVSQYFPSLSYNSSILKILVYGFVIAGVSFLFIAIVAFVKAQTTVNPHKPETSSSLVTTGLYRISRNPMYLAMAVLLIAGAIHLANLASLLGPIVFVSAITYLQIKPEEEILGKQFGEVYEAYCQQTRRWI